MPRRWSRGGIVEVDLHLVLADDDLLGDGLDDVALFLVRELGPALVQVPRPHDDLLLRQVADLHHVELGLRSRDLLIELPEAVGPGVILRTESVLVDHPGLVEIVELVDLAAELLALRFKNAEQFRLRMDGDVRPLQVRADLIR